MQIILLKFAAICKKCNSRGVSLPCQTIGGLVSINIISGLGEYATARPNPPIIFESKFFAAFWSGRQLPQGRHILKHEAGIKEG